MVAPDERQIQSPIQAATTARKIAAAAMETGQTFRLPLPAPVAACFVGLSVESLKQANLILRQESGTTILEVTRPPAAETEASRVSEGMGVAQFLGLRQLVTAADTGAARRVARGKAGQVVEAMAATERFQSLGGLVPFIQRHGYIPSDDLPNISACLGDLYDAMPREIRDALASFNPHTVRPF
jgi:hypothetical protein